MNFAGAKENIQPLAAGRNVEQLEVALNAESHHECHEELLQQRKKFESDIMNYVGDDPIDLWFEYISWVEQSYPKSGKESALDDLLKKCLSTFEKDDRYKQDTRFIRLFTKYIDTKENPHLYYSKLYNNGVGTMVADLYIAWAHYFDVIDDFERAKSVYQKGLDARAAPIDHLKQIYERFQYSVGQRIVRKEEYRQEFLTDMEARRNAFTSLRSLKRSKVGSIRTGSAVKSLRPGQVTQSQPRSALSTSNAPLTVYEGKSETVEATPQPYRSVVEEIESSAIENNIEPGPWSKAASNRKSVYAKVNRNSTLKLAIFEDETEQPAIDRTPFPTGNENSGTVPKDHARKNRPQTEFTVPAYVEDQIEPNTLPEYPKSHCHPTETKDFSLEEFRLYKRMKRGMELRQISKTFLEEKFKCWGIGNQAPTRVLRNFPRTNQPQLDMETERPDISSIPETENFLCSLENFYPPELNTEISYEELHRHQSIDNNANDGMDETVCIRGRQSFGVAHTRKSIATGGRKSIMPSAYDKGFNSRNSTIVEDSSSDMEIDDWVENHKRQEKVSAGVSVEKRVENDRKRETPVAVPVEKVADLPKTQWSVFTDDAQNPTKNTSPIFSCKATPSTVDSSIKSKEIFAIPQVPISRSIKTSETTSETPAKSALPERSMYAIGPETGAIRKTIRKSLVAENAIPILANQHVQFNRQFGNNENTDLDYSLCTQAFNVNLAEQMASTPVAARRMEPLSEQIRAQDTQPPLKLSTIMETTEGSAHTISTKSSTQFSSPEDDELSKQSNVTIRTKFTVCLDDDVTGTFQNTSQLRPMEEFTGNSYANVLSGATNHLRNVERTLPSIQLSMLPESTQNEISTTEAAVKDVPSKSYPFPIFEDTQTITNVSPEPQPPQNLSTAALSLVPVISTANPTNQFSSKNDLQCSNHSNDGQFNMTSFWVKDEPQSYASSNSVAEDSFVIPIARPNELLPERSRPAETDNNFRAMNRTEDRRQMDLEESFALPNISQCEAVPEPNCTNRTFEADDDDESSESEEEIILVDDTIIDDAPKILHVQSLANNNFVSDSRISISLSEEEMAQHLHQKANMKDELKTASDGGDHDGTVTVTADDSIYFKKNSTLLEPSWIENVRESDLLPDVPNVYQHEQVNLEESRMIIDSKLSEPIVDPFDPLLRNAILEEQQFLQELEASESAELVCNVPPVTVKRTIPFKDTHFDVMKCIGHGAYGRVYNVKFEQTATTYAVKKEKPANLWECYILKEVHRRIQGDVLSGYMRIDMAIIGNDGSLLFSQYSPYGTLLDVCNRVFTSIQNHVNETIVLFLAYQMLDLVDHLHKVGILHLDLKPDNFLVMKQMSTNHKDFFIQLIDFGNAVDLRKFPNNQQFNAALETKHFVCIEMLEQRQWKYQPDLFCLAATIHSVLFGRYMEVLKIGQNFQAKFKIPRYFNGVWNRFFNELINSPANTTPDLLVLKKLLDKEIHGADSLLRKINEFNSFILPSRL